MIELESLKKRVKNPLSPNKTVQGETENIRIEEIRRHQKTEEITWDWSVTESFNLSTGKVNLAIQKRHRR